jgi:hypothetical protein
LTDGKDTTSKTPDVQPKPDPPVVGSVVPATGAAVPPAKPAADSLVSKVMGGFVTQKTFDEETKAVRETIRRLMTDFLRSVQALHLLNARSAKNHDVNVVCLAILEPEPELVAANDSISEIRSKVRGLGELRHVVIDWDFSWTFLLSIRGENGYMTDLPGFDLRPEKYGYKALQEAIKLMALPLNLCHLEPITDVTPPPQGELPRRLIYTVKEAAKK